LKLDFKSLKSFRNRLGRAGATWANVREPLKDDGQRILFIEGMRFKNTY
jgi:hypothetical protein